MVRLQPRFSLCLVELLEERNVPATLSVSKVAGDLLIADTAGVVNGLTMSVELGNLVITDAAEQFGGTGGFAGASLSNGDKTLSIPLASLAGANVSIDGAAGNDTLTINALPGFASGLTIGSLTHPLASVTFAGTVSLPAGKDLNVWGGTIAVSGAVSTAGGAITFSATNDITIGDAISSGGGAIALNADSDANGNGTLTLSAASFATWTQQQQITAADGAADDQFGISMALSGDGNTAIVGVWQDDVGGNVNQGTATVFTRSGGLWTQQQQITAAGGAASDNFGISVALSSDGNTAIVGAYLDDVGGNSNQGTATIFTRSAGFWTEQQQITAAGGAAGDSFGISVALSSDGNTAIVGAYGDDVGGNVNQGTATIFTRSGGIWTQQQQIAADGAEAYDSFGISVALSGDGNTALIGALLDDVGGNFDQGTATIFTRSGSIWTQQQQITAADGAPLDYFGVSVALSGDGNTAIVGALLDDVGGNVDQGTATIFTRSGSVWTQQQQITAADGAAVDYFGISVALSGDGNTTIVGARLDDVGGIADQGTATIFTRSGSVWTQQQQITAAGGSVDDQFGSSVALSSDGNTSMVGAYRDDVGGNANQGTATIFTRSGDSGGSLNAGAGAVAITAAAVQPKNTTVNEITAAAAAFNSGSDLRIAITGATNFDTLNVSGPVDLSGVDLVVTGVYVPVPGDIFTIVSATTRTGFFNNRPDGSTFAFNGVVFRIDYTATAVTLTAVSPPTVTSINPVAGPTTGGTLVIITGTGFTGATSVAFGGTNATSYTVLSNSSIQAVAPAHAAGIVDVIVTNNGQASANTPADNFEYIQSAAAPQFGSFTVNGGDMYAINAYGVKVAGLAGNNSIIEQLYVTFDIGVTLDAGAFTLDAGPVSANIPGGMNPVAAGTNVVTIIAEADPTTLDINGGHKGYRLRFGGSAAYLNTFDNSPTGNGGEGNIFTTLKDGHYKLNIVGANVHAGSTVAGTPMASNVTQGFWTMFASYAPDDRSISATPGDGNSIISVNSSVIDFANTNGFGYGTSLTGPSGQAYNANFDWNLDGDVGDDLIEFAKRFGAEWAF
jgi:hypothetical protein